MPSDPPMPRSDPAPPTDPRDRVAIPERIAYGLASPAYTWVTWVPKNMANQVFNMHLGVAPSLITTTFLVFRLWDAVTDPLMGWISDNFRSRWGRRRPFIIAGAVLTALFFPMLWMVDRSWSDYQMIAWFLAIGLLLYTASTLGNMPYEGLLLEMTPDYNERTRVAAVRTFISKFAGLTSGWLWALTQLPCFADPETGAPDTLRGMQAASFVMAGIILVFGLAPGLFCRERNYVTASRRPKIPLTGAFRRTLQNRPFLLLAGAVFMMFLGDSMVQGFNAYVITYYVFGGDQGAASILWGVGNTIITFTGLVAVPFFAVVSTRIGKERTLLLILVLSLIVALSNWFVYNPALPWLSITPLVIGLAVRTGLWMLVPAMLADIVDHDELQTGERREGLFASVNAWGLKMAASVGFGISGPILEWTGFDVGLGGQQPESALFNMRLAMVIIPSAALLLSLVCFARYPLSQATAARIRSALEERRGRLDGR